MTPGYALYLALLIAAEAMWDALADLRWADDGGRQNDGDEQ